MHQDRLVTDYWRAAFKKRDLVVFMEKRLNVSQQPCSILGCIRKNTASTSREMILPFWVNPGETCLENQVQVLVVQYGRDADVLSKPSKDGKVVINLLI